MKKTIAALLLLALVIGLVGCNAGGTPETTAAATTAPDADAPLMVGYSRVDITPRSAVPLGGYGMSERRVTDKVLDPLYLTCIAFEQGGQKLLWFTMDLIGAKGDMVMTTRLRMVRKFEIPADRIMFCATHTHSGPDLGSSLGGIAEYKELFQDAALAAAELALADLAPATISGTKKELERMNYIRHYIMNDGTYYGSNFGSTASGFKCHVNESDNQMQLVKFDREEKDDILVMNWQAHPCFTGGGTAKNISADYIGAVRTAIERETGMKFAFFQGAQGNHNARSAIPNETLYSTNDVYGEKLAEEAISALADLKPIEGSGIKSVTLRYEADVNHEDEHLQKEAQEVRDLWNSTGGDNSKANALARTYGISSVYHANAILARPARPLKDDMEMNAVYVAGMAFITAPIEMFDKTGIYIKTNSPFEMTFICGNSNESHGYIPTTQAYEYGCYESFTSYFAKGTSELMQVKYIEMLNELK